MKVSVEKVPEGVTLTLVGDTKSGPQTIVLTPAEVPIVTELLKTVLKADQFSFSWET